MFQGKTPKESLKIVVIYLFVPCIAHLFHCCLWLLDIPIIMMWRGWLCLLQRSCGCGLRFTTGCQGVVVIICPSHYIALKGNTLLHKCFPNSPHTQIHLKIAESLGGPLNHFSACCGKWIALLWQLWCAVLHAVQVLIVFLLILWFLMYCIFLHCSLNFMQFKLQYNETQ